MVQILDPDDALTVLTHPAFTVPLVPPAPATKRYALETTTIGNAAIEAGRVVHVRLAGDLAFGAGPHRCPGREHALALAGVASEVVSDVLPDGARP